MREGDLDKALRNRLTETFETREVGGTLRRSAIGKGPTRR